MGPGDETYLSPLTWQPVSWPTELSCQPSSGPLGGKGNGPPSEALTLPFRVARAEPHLTLQGVQLSTVQTSFRSRGHSSLETSL